MDDIDEDLHEEAWEGNSRYRQEQDDHRELRNALWGITIIIALGALAALAIALDFLQHLS
jgi:hypothetical protein